MLNFAHQERRTQAYRKAGHLRALLRDGDVRLAAGITAGGAALSSLRVAAETGLVHAGHGNVGVSILSDMGLAFLALGSAALAKACYDALRKR